MNFKISVLYGLSLTIVGTAKGPVQARELRRGAFIFAPKSESGKHQPSHITQHVTLEITWFYKRNL